MDLNENTTATIELSLDEGRELLGELEGLSIEDGSNLYELYLLLTGFVNGDNRW